MKGNRMTDYIDFPFYEATRTAEQLTNQGHDVYQKYSCAGCGQRLTMEIPNIFYKSGTCDKCDTVTDIEKQGCNYMVHMRIA